MRLANAASLQPRDCCTPPLTPTMDKDNPHVAERILNLALEIICLLTRETFPSVKSGDLVTIAVPPPYLLTIERDNEEKILEVTNRIIKLLTGEVLNGPEEVEVSISLEQVVPQEVEKALEEGDPSAPSEQNPVSTDIPEASSAQLDPAPSPSCTNDVHASSNPEDDVSAMCDPMIGKLDLNASMDFSSCDEADLSDGDIAAPTAEVQPPPVCTSESEAADACTEIVLTTVDCAQFNATCAEPLPSAATSSDQAQPPSDPTTAAPELPTPADTEHVQAAAALTEVLATTSTSHEQSAPAETNHTPPTTTPTAPAQSTPQPISTQAATTKPSQAVSTPTPKVHMRVIATSTGEVLRIPATTAPSAHVVTTPPARTGHVRASVTSTGHVVYTPIGTDHTRCKMATGQGGTATTSVGKAVPTPKRMHSGRVQLITDPTPSLTSSEQMPTFIDEQGKVDGLGKIEELCLSPDKKPMCPVCGKCFRWLSEVHYHMRKHTGEKPYCCGKCGQRFSRIPHLVIHERSHTGERPFICTECKKCFGSKSELNEHRKRHRGIRSHPCPECDKMFITKSDLAKHKRSHTGERPHPCSICGKCFSLRSGVLRHEKTHTGDRPYACTECGKAYVSNSELINHMRTHTGERPFTCLECGKSFYNSSDLMKHRRIHTGERPHLCAICGKAYSSKSVLYRHQKIHTKVKPFSCETCGKCFSKIKTLEAHQKTHKKIKPHCCDECGKCFYRPSALIKHKRVHTQ